MPMKHTTLIVSLCALLSVAACQRKDNPDNKPMGSRGEPPASVAPRSTAALDHDNVALAMEDDAPATVGASVADAAITANVSAALASDPALAHQPIKVATHEGVVRLAGTVDSVASARRAAAIAAEVDGVINVDNRLNLMVSR